MKYAFETIIEEYAEAYWDYWDLYYTWTREEVGQSTKTENPIFFWLDILREVLDEKEEMLLAWLQGQTDFTVNKTGTSSAITFTVKTYGT